jgi:hypothetical protein
MIRGSHLPVITPLNPQPYQALDRYRAYTAHHEEKGVSADGLASEPPLRGRCAVSGRRLYVTHKLVKNTVPCHNVKHNDTLVPPKCRKSGKQAVSNHSVWLDLSLKRVLSVEFIE